MAPTYHELAAQARELTSEDRVRLTQALISTFSVPRSPEESRREVKKIVEGRIGFSASDRERVAELLARPVRAVDRRVDDVERRLGSLGARLEELEARVIDGEAD
jgi:hypothetical protein